MHINVRRPAWSAVPAVLAIAALSAGVATSASAHSAKHHATATATLNMDYGTAPQSLDPGLDYTTQGSEINWLVYTGLTTYSHKGGVAGAQLIPGLASSLPKISDHGKTYTVTLRKGLKFSDGTPVVASDFTTTVERAINIPWGGAGSFIIPVIKGASAYAAHKAKTISGIQANDATGKIVIHLTSPYGPFDNVLAFPALGIIPSNTPMKSEPSTPPPGVGPYKVTNINPNVSWNVVKNPIYDANPIPGIPKGHVNFADKVNSNVEANALSVLGNTADIFDWADTVPGALLARVNSQAKGRFSMVNMGGSTYYIFMNMTKAPFNNQDARAAVVTGLDERAMNSLGSGTLAPACFFLPPAVPGHPAGAKCPYGNPAKGGNIAKAKALVKASGQANVPITVYSQERPPRSQWMQYYQSLLKKIGFTHVTIKQVADANYWGVIGQSKKVNPQTGFADWNQDFPNPVDFYGVLLDGHAILPTNNENFGQTNDARINKAVAKLGSVPTTKIGSVVKQWQQLDQYVAKKAYVAVFGYEKFPFFTSSRVKRSPSMVNPIYGWDLSQLGAK